MALSYLTAVRTSELSAVNTSIGSSAQLIIYSGTPPASANAALSSNTVLATLTCGSGGFGTVASGVLTANAITSAAASASGTASFFRVLTSGGTVQIQGTAGTSGTDMILNSTSISSGQTVSVSSFVLTDGNP